MKCPKCGYLGFETTDRCRNCQYDFSLTPFAPDPELTLHGADHQRESPSDFELPPIARQGDGLSATALDLDRLFGDPEPAIIPPSPAPEPPPVVRGAGPFPTEGTGLDEEPRHIQTTAAASARVPSMSTDSDRRGGVAVR